MRLQFSHAGRRRPFHQSWPMRGVIFLSLCCQMSAAITRYLEYFASVPEEAPRQRTACREHRVCKHFARGHCKRASTCRFVHARSTPLSPRSFMPYCKPTNDAASVAQPSAHLRALINARWALPNQLSASPVMVSTQHDPGDAPPATHHASSASSASSTSSTSFYGHSMADAPAPPPSPCVSPPVPTSTLMTERVRFADEFAMAFTRQQALYAPFRKAAEAHHKNAVNSQVGVHPRTLYTFRLLG